MDRDKFIKDLVKGITASPNTVYKWMPSDTKELFAENLKTNRARLEELGWTTRKIDYHADNIGLRNTNSLELGKQYTMFLGCSHTYGIGLEPEHVWTHHVAQYMDTECYNGAFPGHGIDSCYRMLVYALENGYTIKNIFMLAPSPQRVEYYDEKEKKWMVIAWWSGHHKTLTKAVTHDYFTQVNYDKTYDAIRYLCLKNNITLVDLQAEDPEIDPIICEDRSARDLMHAGLETHKFIAEKFIQKYEMLKFP